jgi:membrane protein
MKKQFKNILTVSKTAFKEWWAKDPFKESAVIAYYAIFSLPGLLVVIVSVAGYFFGQEAVNGQITAQITSTMGADTAQQIQDIIAKGTESKNSLWATIIGVITILVGATGVFVELQKALNIIWKVKAKPRRAVFTVIRTRLFSFGLILSIGFLLLISLTITTIIAIMSEWVMNHWPNIVLIIFYALNFIISFGVVMLLFALLFKILPDAKIQWKHLWLGSIITTLLFILGKTAIGFYLSKTNPGSAYGAAGSIVLILLWVSYSSMIFFYGAEFIRAYADYFTGKVSPTEVAVKITDKADAKH